MVIYIELVLIVNLLIHLSLVILIHKLLFIKYSRFLILGLIFDTIYMLLYIYEFIYYDFIKYLFPFLLIFLSFKTNVFTYLKVSVTYLLVSYTLGGVAFVINISGNLEYVLIFLILEFVFFILMFLSSNKGINVFYNLNFKYRNITYNISAFLDTGCSIWHKGLPVIVLNIKYKFDIKTLDVININSGISSSKEEVYYIDRLKIDKKIISCYCVFLDIDYDAIIGGNVL